jgi:hypothetical protein
VGLVTSVELFLTSMFLVVQDRLHSIHRTELNLKRGQGNPYAVLP